MKVLICHNSYQRPGGEDAVFSAESELLEAAGHQIVHYRRHNDEIAGIGRADLVRRTMWNPDTTRDLSRLIESERPDVLHCHNTFPLISPSAYAAARSLGVAVVQTLHNYRLLCPKAELQRDGKVCEDCLGKSVAWPAVAHACYKNDRAASATVASLLALHRVNGTFAKQVDRYITPTAFVKRKFVEGGFPERRISIKPNFVTNAPSPGDGGGDYAVFVGRLSEEKGVRCLLDAWKMVPNGLGLKILGDGPLANAVVEAAARDPRIEWLGHRERGEVYDTIGRAKLLVMPSVWYETFGLCLVEAFACGTPVIASRMGAMAEIVDDGRTGLLFQPGDAKALAEAVGNATRNPTNLHRMRTAARTAYERSYTPEANLSMLLDIYDQAIGTGPTWRAA